MTFGYVQPFSFRLGRHPELKVAGVRHGVTEIALNDGRRVRATLHVKGVSTSAGNPGTLDVSYHVVTEIVDRPATTILEVHETLQ